MVSVTKNTSKSAVPAKPAMKRNFPVGESCEATVTSTGLLASIKRTFEVAKRQLRAGHSSSTQAKDVISRQGGMTKWTTLRTVATIEDPSGDPLLEHRQVVLQFSRNIRFLNVDWTKILDKASYMLAEELPNWTLVTIELNGSYLENNVIDASDHRMAGGFENCNVFYNTEFKEVYDGITFVHSKFQNVKGLGYGSIRFDTCHVTDISERIKLESGCTRTTFINMADVDVDAATLDGTTFIDCKLSACSFACLYGARLKKGNTIRLESDDAWLEVAPSPSADYPSHLNLGSFGSVGRITTAFISTKGVIMVECGCFWGTLAEFRTKVEKSYGEDSYNCTKGTLRYYKTYLTLAKLIEEQFADFPLPIAKAPAKAKAKAKPKAKKVQEVIPAIYQAVRNGEMV